MSLSWPFEDMHVHSTFSDGAATLEENIARARELGMRRITCVDHVRRDTDWLPDYVAAVESWKGRTEVEVLCGIEAKILTLDGELDMPSDTSGVDRVYVADHQMPGAEGPIHPAAVKKALEAGETSGEQVFAELTRATARAVADEPRAVIAHLFSILPKLGLDEADVPEARIVELAEAARAAGCRIEIDERWRCPGPGTVRHFSERGIPVLASTDSHRLETLGQFDFVRSAFGALGLDGDAVPAAA